jgi:hypothetical protein
MMDRSDGEGTLQYGTPPRSVIVNLIRCRPIELCGLLISRQLPRSSFRTLVSPCFLFNISDIAKRRGEFWLKGSSP